MEPITIATFLGANLAFDELQLPAGVGVVSLNQRPGYADLRPWNDVSDPVATVPSSPQRKTIYRMGQDVADDANYWFSFSTVVHAVRGFDTDDTSERTYFSGSGTPKWTDNTMGLSGGPPYPQATRELAVPAPTTAIVAALNTDASSGSDQAFMFIYTFVNDIGWESAPSEPSNSILAKPGATFDLSNFDTAPAGNYGISTIRLYRFEAGSGEAGAYFFEREWAIGATPSNPIDDARGLGEDPISTIGWRPPPADGAGLTKMWSGMLAIGSGKGVRVCVPFEPYAWPLGFEIALTALFVAMGVWGQHLLILTTGDAVVVTGTSPDSLDDEPAKVNRPCASATSVVEFNEGSTVNGVAWASNDCLCWYGDGGYRSLTDGILTPEQWRALHPETMVASRHQGFYICFFDDGVVGAPKGFVIDPNAPQYMTFLSAGFDAVFRDPITDRLYVLEHANVRKWDSGAPMTATFRSKLIELPAAANIGAIEVIAKGFPVTVKMWGDGVLRLNQSATGPAPIRPSGAWQADQLQFEVSSTSRVIALRAARTVGELTNPT